MMLLRKAIAQWMLRSAALILHDLDVVCDNFVIVIIIIIVLSPVCSELPRITKLHSVHLGWWQLVAGYLWLSPLSGFNNNIIFTNFTAD